MTQEIKVLRTEMQTTRETHNMKMDNQEPNVVSVIPESQGQLRGAHRSKGNQSPVPVPKMVAPITTRSVNITQLPEGSGKEARAETSGFQADASWTTVTNKRRRRVTIRGMGEPDNELQAVESLKRIHLWSMKVETTADEVAGFMKRKNPSGQAHYSVEKLELKHKNYSSFVLTVPESCFDFFMNGLNWPKNVRINEWFRKRNTFNRTELGQKNASGAIPCTQ